MRASLPFTRARAFRGTTRACAKLQTAARPAARATARGSIGVCAGVFFDARSSLTSTSTSTSSISSSPPRRSVSAAASPPSSPPAAPAKVKKALPPAITLTENAVRRCLELKKTKNMRPEDTLFLRVGVRSGGCNGMSYTMDFTEETKPDDHVFEATSTSGSGGGAAGGAEEEGENKESVKIVCDPKSLLFLFGLQLDYSDALIGGGFSFQNPNAEGSCGCGKSFNV